MSYIHLTSNVKNCEKVIGFLSVYIRKQEIVLCISHSFSHMGLQPIGFFSLLGISDMDESLSEIRLFDCQYDAVQFSLR